MSKREEKIQFLEALALLHCESLGRKETLRFTKEDQGQISVLLDTAVIYGYLLPQFEGPLRSTRIKLPDFMGSGEGGLGQLLPRLPTSLLDTVAQAQNSTPVELRRNEDVVAWHSLSAILRQVFDVARGADADELQPLLQFKSHFEETNNILRISKNRYLAKFGRERGIQPVSDRVGARTFRRSTAALLRHKLWELENEEPNVINILEPLAEVMIRRGEIALMNDGDGRGTLEKQYENAQRIENDYQRLPFDTKYFKEGLLSDDKFDADFLEIEWHARSLLTSFFKGRLAQNKPRSSAISAKGSDDVEALVSLACQNRRLLHLSVSHRLLFVTSDTQLVLSCYAISDAEIAHNIKKYCMRKLVRGDINPAESRELIEQLQNYFTTMDGINALRWFENFSAHYVRHIWAVAEDSLIEPHRMEALQENMFNGLYAEAGERTKIRRREVEEMFTRNKFLRDIAIEKFEILSAYQHWINLTKLRVKTEQLRSMGLQDMQISEPSLEEAIKATPEMIFEVLEEYSLRNRDRAMVNLSDHGAHSLISGLQERGYRGRPVDLNFVTLKKTNQVFENLASKNYYVRNLEKFISDFEEINIDCYGKGRSITDVFDDRQRSHLKYLVLSSTFAAMEKWAASLDHCRRAINIIERNAGEKGQYDGDIPVLRGSGSNMSGREARYLNCICERMLAKNNNDLTEARRSLKDAFKALCDDRKAREDLNFEYFALRFANENWSIDIAQYYLARSDQPNFGIDALPTTRVFIPQYDDIVGELPGLKGPQQCLGCLVDLLQKNENLSLSEALTQDAVAFNLLQANIILEYWKAEGALVDADKFSLLLESGFVALRHLRERTSNSDYIESPLVKLYRRGLATVYDCEDGFANVAQLTHDYRFFQDEAILNETRVPYDRWRITKIHEFISDRIS